jgi:hypothetical protein
MIVFLFLPLFCADDATASLKTQRWQYWAGLLSQSHSQFTITRGIMTSLSQS